MPYIYPIILSGGVGSRLWPVSRGRSPKQLLSLVGDRSLLEETVLRTIGADFAKPLIICHSEHASLVMEQMRSISVEPEKIILEPTGRNTAPAAAIAALIIAEKDPSGVVVLMPADHIIHDQAAFRRGISVARDLAERGHLVTLGVHPNRADTGYGYIKRGSPLGDQKAFAVSQFVEKPDAATALQYTSSGNYYWNSGVFVFQPRTYLFELQKLQPDIVSRCQTAISAGIEKGGCYHLAREPFEACKSISIDYAVMEHTDKAAVVPVDMGWNDIGSWAALWEIGAKDADGNVIKGDVLLNDAHNSYLRSEGPLIAALGVSDLVVVASPDVVLVTPRSAAQEIKKIVEQLEREGRDPHNAAPKVYHPWGTSERIDKGNKFEINRITVNPNSIMPLEMGVQHIRQWIIVSGRASVRHGGENIMLKESENYIPSGADRWLQNITIVPLQIIEIKTLLYPTKSMETGQS